MKFGQRILALQQPEWAPYYLNYIELKKVLESLEQQQRQRQQQQQHRQSFDDLTSSIRSIGGRLSIRRLSLSQEEPPESSHFLQQLNLEVKKIVLFVLQQEGQIANDLTHCGLEQQSLLLYVNNTVRPEQFQSLRDKYNAIGANLLHLIQFVDLNVKGIQKILKKHDKVMRWSASDLYLKGSRRSSDMMKPLLNEEPLAALCVTLETALTDLRRQEDFATDNIIMASGTYSSDGSSPLGETESKGITMKHSVSEPQFLPVALRDRRLSEWHHESFGQGHYAGGTASSPRPHHHHHPEDVILLAHIYTARRRMKQSNEFTQLLAASSLVAPVPEVSPSSSSERSLDEKIQSEYEQASASAAYKRSSYISSILNLVSSFVYMANYLIVIPTITTYSEKLGSSVAMSSAIVGMMPFATLFSTILYSWWTTYSYRYPLICASLLNIIGNFIYAMALPCHSMPFVLIGRLLSGFGSCRPINRRYIADAFSTAERTAASALFVAVGSLGMAAGPFLGSVLHRLAENSLNPYWQVENAPGWFMFAVWSIYLVFLLIFFVDPPKHAEPEPPVSTTMNGEHRPLLLKAGSASCDQLNEQVPIWKNAAVMTNFLIYFVEKLLMECVSSSTSILTYYYFDWPGSAAGMYLSFLCLLILPVNLLVAYLSKIYEDREMMMVMQAVTVVGCLLILRYGATYTIEQYVAGSMIIVVFSNMLEGPNMSLLSKTIPKSWRKGIMNVGLLATEAATLGRTVGDAFLVLCGSGGLENQLNYTFGSMTIVTIITMCISYRFYDSLVPTEDKDD